MTVETRPFDPAAYLTSDESIAAYLADALATEDPVFLADALGVIVRARGTARVASEAGLSRDDLSRALGQDGASGLSATLRLLAALGVRLSQQPAGERRGPGTGGGALAAS